MKRIFFVIALVVCLFVPSALGGQVPTPDLPPVIVPPELAHETLLAMGVSAPEDTCAGDPALPHCPPVTYVVITPPPVSAPPPPQVDSHSIAPRSIASRYAPQVTPRRARALDDYAPQYCTVDASVPWIVDGGVYGYGSNYCSGNTGASYMEVDVTLQRFYDSAWYDLARCHSEVWGPAFIGCSPGFDCNHYNSRYYRSEALAYARIRGIGYTGVKRSDLLWTSCA